MLAAFKQQIYLRLELGAQEDVVADPLPKRMLNEIKALLGPLSFTMNLDADNGEREGGPRHLLWACFRQNVPPWLPS
eukprot:SAG22_NODE_589_length_8828_cov_4.479895_1_plen_77_part_00